MKYSCAFMIFIVSITLCSCMGPQPVKTAAQEQLPPEGLAQSTTRQMSFGMKGVGIDLPQQDFIEMKEAGIDVLGTEWGMEEDTSRAKAFLDQAQKAGLKVVMDGGFSYTAWGFTEHDWDRLPGGKRPVWQKERVQNWVRALKYHPAIYAWDISNEFGENLPSGAGVENSGWPESMVTIAQIRQAKEDVLAVDPSRPTLVRIHGWDVDQMPSYVRDLLGSKIANIISLNLYSNYIDKGKLQWPDVIDDAGLYFVSIVKKEDPNVTLWLSLAAFEYPVIFERPTAASLERDISESLLIPGVNGISFFCWGPVNQWDDKANWYLPQTGADLWKTIREDIRKAKRPN